jgi:NodT family efflux transporter outer membrane factor (OMF) lipoprotein
MTNPEGLSKALGHGRAVVGVLLLAAALLSAGGCLSDRADVSPPTVVPAVFSTDGNASLREKWWTSFEDERLTALVAEATAENFSLRVAWDRLRQARAIAARAGAPLWPTLDGTGGATRSVRETDSGPKAGRTYTTDLSLGLVAAYEVDLWGRIRATNDAALLDVEATRADLQAAAITLCADVARTYFRLVEQRRQRALLIEQRETNEKVLEIVTQQFRRGQVGAADVLQQRQLVENTAGRIVQVESTLAVLKNQLAVLLGRTPGRDDMPVGEAALPGVPPLPRTGVPAAWLTRRPDLRAAVRRIQAADRRVWAARADRLPRLSVTLSASTSAEQVRDLFDNWLASMAANLTAPLIDGGRRVAEVERTRAVLSERINAFGQTYLAAMAEVENALAQEAQQRELVGSLGRQLDFARRATDRVLDSYRKGTTDFTRYLTTLRSYQELQRTHLAARRDWLLFRVDLYRALAGGWELSAPPAAELQDDPRDETTPQQGDEANTNG